MSLIGWNKDNILKFTIGNTYISEDLVNFPVLLNLSSSSGLNLFNCDKVFTELFSEGGVIYSESVCFYLNFENDFIDVTGKHTLTTSALINSSIKKFGTKSAYVNSTSITISNGSDLAIGTNDFTFHGWFYMTDVTTSTALFELGNYVTGIVLCIMNSNLFWGIANAWAGDATWTAVANVWTHIALTRHLGIARVFVDGVKKSERNYPASISTSGNCRLGLDAAFINGVYHGYMDEIILVNGVAVWTADFTVPTIPTVLGKALPKKMAVVYPSVQEHLVQGYDDYTKILIQSNSSADGSTTIVDSSNFKSTINIFGNTKHSTAKSLYGTSAIYFDGVGDYLSLPAGSTWDFGLLDFTIETWLYIVGYNTNSSRILQTSDGDVYAGIYMTLAADGALNVAISTNGSAFTFSVAVGSLLALNRFYHIAFVRYGTEFSVYIDGAKYVVYTGALYVYYNAAATPIIGGQSGTNRSLNGYIDKFKISKGIARYTTSFSVANPPPTSSYFSNIITNDSYWSNTVLALSMNGVNNSTTILDFKGKAITITGNVKLSSDITKFGTTSAYFDGNGDYLSAPGGSDFSLDGNYTVEAWVYILNLSTNGNTIFDTRTTGAQTSLSCNINENGYLTTYIHPTSTSSTATVSLNIWTHVAWSRVGNLGTFYKNGIACGNYVHTAPGNGGNYCKIGANVDGSYSLNGYMADFRITKGMSRSITNFIPSTSNISSTDAYWGNVTLALPLTGADNSTVFTELKGLTITAYGDTKIVTTLSKFGTGSAYFDGTGDYLSTPSLGALGTSDWTYEVWVYPTANTVAYMPICGSSHYGASLSGEVAIMAAVDGKIIRVTCVIGSTDYGVISSIAFTLNSWQHIAVVRSNGSITLFKDGILIGTNTAIGTLSIPDPGVPFMVGRNSTTTGTLPYFNGYISDVRVTKGTARYIFSMPVPEVGINVLVPSDPYYSSVVLALPMANSIIDLKGKSLAISGNTLITNTVNKFGATSCYFDGNGDYITLGYSTDLDLVGSTFTIELWIYPTALVNRRIICSGGGTVAWNSTTGIHWMIQTNSAGQIEFSYWTGSIGIAAYTCGYPTANQWSFIAVSVTNTVIYTAVNGVVQAHTMIASMARPSTNPSLAIGTIHGEVGASGTAFTGYMSDIRITKGIARYTTSFSIPASAYEKTSIVKTYTCNSNQQLYCEIERWDYANKSAQLWVNVPRVLSNQPTDIFLYFDRTQADNTYIGFTGEYAAQQVWDLNYSAVYHLSQDPSAGGACIKDSTYNMRHGTPYGSMTSASLVGGVAGSKALLFDGTSQYIECGTFDPRPLNSAVTMEATYSLVSISSTSYLFVKGNDNLAQSYGIGLPSPNAVMALAYNNSYPPAWPSTPWRNSTQAFVYAAEVISGSTVTGYDSDTACAATAIPGTYSTTTAPFRIAATNRGAPYTYYANAKVREARISQVARSTSWLKATNHTISDSLCTISSGIVYTYTGYTTEKNVPIQRTMYLYDRTSGELMDKCISSVTGYYSLKTTLSGVHNIVCLDDAIGTSYDDLIMSKVLPTGVL
ncbi:DUF2341 domain-containing protein [bacterium]|nr:DUF2341 domain-containing protein [bacterium]